MEILEQIRTQLHNNHLKKALAHISVRRSSVFLENAKTIGVLFDATLLEERNIATDFIEQLKKKGKEVRALGFFNEKLKSSDFPFQHFDKKKLDWCYRPTCEKTKEFANHSCDLLINLTYKTILPLDYIAAHSCARFRVGPFTENTFCYDLMIEHKEKEGLAAFIKQVLHYLQKMQPETEAALI